MAFLQLFARSAVNTKGGAQNATAGTAAGGSNHAETTRNGNQVGNWSVIRIEETGRDTGGLTITEIDDNHLISPVIRTEGNPKAGALIVRMHDYGLNQAMSDPDTTSVEG